MNTFEMNRTLSKLTESKLNELAVNSVVKNESQVISDLIVSNADGLTFAGNQIDDVAPFTDWEESGDFHRNLRFLNDKDIELTSNGAGAESVFQNFSDEDTIAPSAKVLDKSTIDEIKKDFINGINNTIK